MQLEEQQAQVRRQLSEQAVQRGAKRRERARAQLAGEGRKPAAASPLPAEKDSRTARRRLPDGAKFVRPSTTPAPTNAMWQLSGTEQADGPRAATPGAAMSGPSSRLMNLAIGLGGAPSTSGDRDRDRSSGLEGERLAASASLPTGLLGGGVLIGPREAHFPGAPPARALRTPGGGVGSPDGAEVFPSAASAGNLGSPRQGNVELVAWDGITIGVGHAGSGSAAAGALRMSTPPRAAQGPGVGGLGMNDGGRASGGGGGGPLASPYASPPPRVPRPVAGGGATIGGLQVSGGGADARAMTPPRRAMTPTPHYQRAAQVPQDLSIGGSRAATPSQRQRSVSPRNGDLFQQGMPISRMLAGDGADYVGAASTFPPTELPPERGVHVLAGGTNEAGPGCGDSAYLQRLPPVMRRSVSGTGVRLHTQKVFAGERNRDGRALDPRELPPEYLTLAAGCANDAMMCSPPEPWGVGGTVPGGGAAP